MSRFIVTRTLDDGNELTIWEEYPGECFVTDTRHPDEEAVFSGYWEECLAYCYDEELATLEKRLDNLEGCEDNEVYAEEIKEIRLKMVIVENHKERLAEKNEGANTVRTYFYCTANGGMYTETEKQKSDWPESRFLEAGRHKNRMEAETVWHSRYWNIYPIMPTRRN